MQKYTFHTLMTASLNLPLRDVLPMSSNNDEGAVQHDFRIKEIVVPEIQRDYAQGRGGDVKNIREDFVESLFTALSDGTGETKCSLNFVYGQLKPIKLAQFVQDVSFVPLDGQQRLTTLFLLHWYLTRLEGKSDEFKYLSCFRYETRYSSSEFTTMFLRDIKDLKLSADDVEWLVKHKEKWLNENKIKVSEGDIVPDGMLAEWLEDKPGFASSWLTDPTISGMLTMLDEIHRRFRKSANCGFLEKLTEEADDCPIYFYFKHILPTADDGELFIKMNSRGKLLTEFEYFKADFQRLLKEGKARNDFRDKVANEIDQKWEPSFWRLVDKYGDEPIKNDGNKFGLSSSDLDTLMMRFVNFAIDTLCFAFRNKNGDGETAPLFTAACKDTTKYSRARLETLLFDKEGNLSADRLNAFESFFDSWTAENEPTAEPGYSYFNETFCTIAERGSGKIPVFAPNTQCQMLLSILAGEVALTAETAVLFYAATFARIRKLDPSTAAERLRMARNLFHKMDHDISSMPYVYRCVKELMESGDINESQTSGSGGKKFPEDQVREEKFKVLMSVQDPRFHSQMRNLEENPWFKGSIAALLPADYDKKTTDEQSLAALFARRKTAFEVSFGKLPDKDIPDALIRSVLFWASRGPYCISAGKSVWYWGSSSGTFAWKENTRPYLSRAETGGVFQIVLDKVSEWMDTHSEACGQALLTALAQQLRATTLGRDGKSGHDAAFYMTTYYDSFFEPFDKTYDKNIGLMRGIDFDTSFRAVNFYAGKTRSKAYWDPYLYVMWKEAGGDANVDGIVNPGGTTGSSARFLKQDVFVDNRSNRFVISARNEQLEQLKVHYPTLTEEEYALHTGLLSASLPIPQHSTNKKADDVDRIQMGVDLFKAISSLSASTSADGPSPTPRMFPESTP